MMGEFAGESQGGGRRSPILLKSQMRSRFEGASLSLIVGELFFLFRCLSHHDLQRSVPGNGVCGDHFPSGEKVATNHPLSRLRSPGEAVNGLKRRDFAESTVSPPQAAFVESAQQVGDRIPPEPRFASDCAWLSSRSTCCLPRRPAGPAGS